MIVARADGGRFRERVEVVRVKARDDRHRAHMKLKMQATSLTELITMAMICGVRTLGN